MFFVKTAIKTVTITKYNLIGNKIWSKHLININILILIIINIATFHKYFLSWNTYIYICIYIKSSYNNLWSLYHYIKQILLFIISWIRYLSTLQISQILGLKVGIYCNFYSLAAVSLASKFTCFSRSEALKWLLLSSDHEH